MLSIYHNVTNLVGRESTRGQPGGVLDVKMLGVTLPRTYHTNGKGTSGETIFCVLFGPTINQLVGPTESSASEDWKHALM